PNCTPLKLPPEKYEAWKDFVVDFSNPEGESSLASSIGPGFDCAKATQPLARLICANPELSKTDLRFNQAFQALRQHLDPAEQGQLQTQPPAPMIYAIFMCFAGAGTCNQLGFYHVAGDQMSQFFATKAECERSISDLIAEEKIAPDFDVRCLGRHVDTWQ
ncbi:MAG TPA: hypothetical protein VFC56_14540, partial [Stellaceae bacterium]|nr:hypothetical protein [Stellaceae bacterium]